MMRLLLIICLSCLAFPALATELLLSDVLYEGGEQFAQVEIRLGTAVEIENLVEVGDNGVRIRLTPLDRAGSGEWSSTEMSFSEADRLLTRVALEGSGRKGYELIIEFSEPITARLLPQFDDRQVLVKVAPQKAFAKLSRFGKPGQGDPYAINLESRRDSLPDVLDIPKSFAETHTVYVTDILREGVRWHRLRLGFFTDQRSAASILSEMRKYFPDAWIERVSGEEVRFAESFKINPKEQVARFTGTPVLPVTPVEEVKAVVQAITPSTIGDDTDPSSANARWESRPEIEPTAPQPQTIAPVAVVEPVQAVEEVPPLEPVTVPVPSELEELLAQARSAFENGDYAQAITLYTRLVAVDGAHREQALEMLGVSRELNRQIAHAKTLYEAYLREYPETEGARRVRQRLAGLLALEQPRNEPRRQPAREGPESWQVSSYLSQFYQRQSLDIDGESSVPIDGIFTDGTLLAFRNGADLDQELRLTTSYLLDFSDQDRLQGREFQVSTLYWDGYSERFRSGVRIGRQSRYEAGVLGRFDGASFTHRPLSNLALNLTGGYLLDSWYDSPDTNRSFFGISSEWVSDSGLLTVAPFYMEQQVDGVLDRRALGLQSQLQSQRGTLFSLVDYDVHYAVLNNLSFMGNYRVRDSQISASYEHRRSPYLTTRNALIGQSYDDLTDLENSILDLQLEDIAADRTATSDTLRLGVNTRLSENWSITADIAASDFSNTESSADVVGLESYKTLYSSLQIRSLDLYGPASYSALMLRRADSDSGDTTSLYWDNRFGLGDNWRLYPRIRVDYRNFDSSGDTQWSARPSMRVDFRYSRRIRFELESGYQWTTRDMATRSLDITGFFIRAGYRANF